MMLERDIEKAVCRYAQTKGMLQYKFSSPARAGVPDRLFITHRGVVWFAEFKRQGERATPRQEREHDRMRKQGVTVVVVDNVDSGKMIVDLMS